MSKNGVFGLATAALLVAAPAAAFEGDHEAQIQLQIDAVEAMMEEKGYRLLGVSGAELLGAGDSESHEFPVIAGRGLLIH